MAGGTFKTMNKTRPGAYIDIVGKDKANVPVSERGILAVPISLDWGATVNVVDYKTDFKKVLGAELFADSLLAINDGLKNSQKIIVYRLNHGGVKASITNANMTLTAKYPGTLGNSLKVVIIEETNGKFLINTYLGTELVDTQEVATASEIVNNDYIDFAITTLEATAGATLSGGTNSTVTNASYTEFLSYIETQKYNTIAFSLTSEESSTLLQLIVNFIERQREELGIKVQAVVPYYGTDTDYEGIILVDNGVKLTDGTIISNKDIVPFVGGLTAGADVNESNTYVKYDGASEPYPTRSHEEIVDIIKAGRILFNEDCKVETDINSLVSFRNGKIKAMSKNRTIRVLDAICNDIKDLFSNNYIGKVNNDEYGRNLFKSEVISYMNNLQLMHAIQNFDSNTDVTVEAGNEKDEVIAAVAVQTTDSQEKLYMTINLV